MKNNRSSVGLVLASGVAAALVSGCGYKNNKKHYEQYRADATMTESCPSKMMSGKSMKDKVDCKKSGMHKHMNHN